MTMGVGFGLGCGLAYLLEFLDSSYRRPDKVEEDFNIPVIATIPAIYSPKAIYKKRIEMGMCGFFAFNHTDANRGIFSCYLRGKRSGVGYCQTIYKPVNRLPIGEKCYSITVKR
jgi:hypothetical protein